MDRLMKGERVPPAAPWLAGRGLEPLQDYQRGWEEPAIAAGDEMHFPCLPILFCPFPDLRLQLLDVKNNPYLIKALYGLLMLLPQSSAFELLSHRLQCVPNPELMQTT